MVDKVEMEEKEVADKEVNVEEVEIRIVDGIDFFNQITMIEEAESKG